MKANQTKSFILIGAAKVHMPVQSNLQPSWEDHVQKNIEGSALATQEQILPLPWPGTVPETQFFYLKNSWENTYFSVLSVRMNDSWNRGIAQDQSRRILIIILPVNLDQWNLILRQIRIPEMSGNSQTFSKGSETSSYNTSLFRCPCWMFHIKREWNSQFMSYESHSSVGPLFSISQWKTGMCCLGNMVWYGDWEKGRGQLGDTWGLQTMLHRSQQLVRETLWTVSNGVKSQALQFWVHFRKLLFSLLLGSGVHLCL